MEQGSQDRNLPASERKLKKARDDGQVGRSEDLSHLAVLGAGAVSVMVLAPILFDRLQHSMGKQLSFDASTVKQTGAMLTRLSDATSIGVAGSSAFAGIITAAALKLSPAPAEKATALAAVASPADALKLLRLFCML